MHATWPMVFGALLAGAVGGFIVPDKPLSRATPAVSESTGSKPTPLKAKRDRDAVQADDESIRLVPLTKAANTENVVPASKPENEAPAPAPKQIEAETPGGCAIKTWPYRIAGCFDRTAPPTAASTVNAKRVEPTAALSAQAPAKSEPAPQKQKIVAAPPPQKSENRPEAAAPPAEPVPARAEAVRPVQSAPRQREARRPQRQLSRELDLDDGVPTRIYLRGPDGRLYLAPEHRPSGQYRYYVR